MINLVPLSPEHDSYAMRLHMQVAEVIDAPSLVAISQLSLLLSVLATCAYMNGRNLNTRSDPSAKAISASANILNRMAKRNGHAPSVEEAKVLILCSGALDRLFRRYPASRLEAVEAKVRMMCREHLEAA